MVLPSPRSDRAGKTRTALLERCIACVAGVQRERKEEFEHDHEVTLIQTSCKSGTKFRNC